MYMETRSILYLQVIHKNGESLYYDVVFIFKSLNAIFSNLYHGHIVKDKKAICGTNLYISLCILFIQLYIAYILC